MSYENDDNDERYNGEEGSDEYEIDDDNIDDYKTPLDDDLEYKGDEENNEDLFMEEPMGKLDTGAEWRDYGDGASKSRVGIARASDIDEDLGTIMMDGKFNKLQLMTRTPEDMFRIISRKIKDRYDLTDSTYDDSLRIMQYINTQNRNLKFKSPTGIILSLLCIRDGKILKDKVVEVYTNMAKNENMTEIDLMRYIFFVKDILKENKK